MAVDGRAGEVDHVETPTVTLNCEFVSSAHEGDWLECHGEVIKRGRSMVFVQGRLVAGDKVVMTCSCVLKRMPRSKFEET
ncbi:MAG: hypothetical protein HOI34_20175 [Rhodospirillaceae bacterium]|nr:hypothetical protein [Rhodospirillaceae bacterium]